MPAEGPADSGHGNARGGALPTRKATTNMVRAKIRQRKAKNKCG